ncbi:protein of unknown function DUF92, transmembrane [Candidatus Koribacter versatilis Ellin345]|uniref:DUF92 domain-containing protein n=1 Tax=Koribacter versatilis (strain Ellin345) TaxID=204669 RepID=Q1INE1_KORVE|nr:DUF92 domain-containing protein [Candidatus Koribacter versatilis]ABF41609.1 protein of unknown function DUF92, transmembrane [Candidatus Koribacter versatilis Ellin345]
MYVLNTFAFSSHDVLSSRIAAALAVTAIFALWARWLKGVTPGGALAGFAVAFAIYLGTGVAGFFVLFGVFLVTAAATHWRRPVKEQHGKPVQHNGRDGRQVLANVSAAAAVCGACVLFPHSTTYLMPGAIAALAETAADTVSSETGEALRGPTFLLIPFRRVEPGPDGAISLGGTTCGLLAALFVAFLAWLTGLLDIWWSLTAAGCGFAGMLFDSILGATIETRGLLGNDGVNFLATIFAADLALLISWLTG